jgi:UDP:flavonoid glycosyltransferase YjiC (YdhE family)
MRIATIVFGSRGDAEPALALAFALTQRGHEAVVSVPEDLVDAASLRAGAPTVVCSVFSDQHFWGATVERLAVGRTFRFTELSTEKLIAAIEPLLTDEARRRSAERATELRAENGAMEAAKLIEQEAVAPT